jgi:hypothetical protein
LYVAGAFSDSGRVSVWNGAWRRAGSELNDSVEDLKVFQVNGSEHLYAAGVFVSPTGPSRVAEFDGQEWQPLGHDLDNPASSLVLFNPGDGPGLYVGGIFNIGSGLKRWNGTTWDNAGPIRCDCGGPQVGCTAVRHDAAGETLYVGGRFTYAGGVAVRNVASFDGQHWHALGSGLNGVLFAMADFDDGGGRNLYVGGVFDAAGAVSTHSIARWDGTQWRPLAENGTDGVAGTVAALAVFDDGTGPALYVGGSFSAAGGQPAANIAKWDGAHWHAVGSGVRGSVQAMAVLRLHGKRSLWVGGSFAAAGELPAVGLAEWVACPSCVADWNDSDTVTTDDFFAFLADFFDGHADVDQDGVTNTQDFFLFLNAFFAGCG